MELRTYGDDASWDAFVAASPQRSVFVTSAFLRSLGTAFERVFVHDGERVVAAAALPLAHDGRPASSPHPFTMYQGVLLAPNDEPPHRKVSQELKTLEATVDRLAQRYGRLCLANHWRLRDLRAFQWYHYHERELGRFTLDLGYAGVLDLAPTRVVRGDAGPDQARDEARFDEYLKTIRTLRRREFKKAHAVRITTSTDVDLLDALHEKTFERQGQSRDAAASDLLRSITRGALSSGFGQLACAWVGDVPASAILFLYDDRTAFYLFGANDPEFRDTGASTRLMLHLIEDAMKRGLSEVDFVGVNSPSRGDYKTSFNAEVFPYHVARFGT